MQGYICEEWGTYTPYKVANLVLEYSTSIPRTQLRPGYGDGFLGAPLHVVPSRHGPTSQEQGDRRGTSSQHTAPDSGGSPHIWTGPYQSCLCGAGVWIGRADQTPYHALHHAPDGAGGPAPVSATC